MKFGSSQLEQRIAVLGRLLGQHVEARAGDQPCVSASTSACSSTSPPREVLISMAVRFIWRSSADR
jgi:hypothetical protein